MFFRYTLDIPANTPESDPVELFCELTRGIVTQVLVGFPPGCAALARLRIFRREHQVWPSNPDKWFAWDNYIFDFQENFELYEVPYELIIRGWNEDECYDHEVMVCFSVHTTPEPFLHRILAAFLGGPDEE